MGERRSRALRYLGRRLAHAGALLLAASLLTFLLIQAAPGDFFAEAELNPEVSARALASWRTRAGLDQPLAVRYGRWLAGLAHGNLGHSWAYDRPVGPLVLSRALNTLALTSVATAIAWLLALAAGLTSARLRWRWLDSSLGTATAVLLSVPDLVITLLLLLLAVQTGYFPTAGMVSLDFSEMSLARRLADVVHHGFLPVSALVLTAAPPLLRHVRASLDEVMDAPFVMAARTHGLSRWRIVTRHVLPAAANPLISLMGVSFGSLLSMSVVVEVILGWPGLGPLFLEAILARDADLVMGPVMASAVLVVTGSLLADVVLYAVDPRIRRRS